MRVAGIIAEYNPFHNGHAHQIRQVRALGFDAVVCVMSPGVVQRGSLALMPVQVRAQAALACGADLVLCLPAPYAAASAEAFAAAGVRALGALGCVQALCYGAETPDAAAHLRAAKALVGPAFAGRLREGLAAGLPFAAARQQAAQAVCEGAGDLLASPNDILGVEYCKAILTQKSALQPLALPHRGGQPVFQPFARAARQAAGFASATALRALAQRSGMEALEPYVPQAALALYLCAQQQGAVLEEARFSTALLCRLRAGCAQGFAHVRGAGEGLENRLAAAVRQAGTAGQLLELLKTKRYATARLRRFALDAALGVPAGLPALPYLHVLGAGEAGLAVLQQAKQAASLPLSASLAVLEKASLPAAQVAALHAAAEDFAALCLASPRPMGTAYTQKFIAPPKG